MNIERYKMPVIIAAGLHGALFLIMPDGSATDIPPPDKTVIVGEIPLTNPPVEEVVPPEDRDTSAPAGGAKPLPGRPDVPPPLKGDEVFVVPVSHTTPSLDPVRNLKDYRGEPIGPGVGPGDLSGVDIPGVGSLDRVPRAMVQPAPNYPDALRRDGTDGAVTVEFVVDTAGRVVSAEAVKWTRREFVEPAVRAVLRWRFEPGTLDGRKVRFRMAVPIEFNASR